MRCSTRPCNTNVHRDSLRSIAIDDALKNFRRACAEDHGAVTPFALHWRYLKTVSIAREDGGRAAHATFVVLAVRSNNAVR
jgi:hypothetical protein